MIMIGRADGMGSFPPEVSSSAVFRCVRMSAVDDMQDQFAYQTAVSIGGHVFKGILYDHGSDSQVSSQPGDASSSSAVAATVATIGNPTTGASTSAVAGPAGASSMLDATSLYATPLSAFLAGTQFFPQPRP